MSNPSRTLICAALCLAVHGLAPAHAASGQPPAYLSPRPGARDVSTGTTIAVRPGPAIEPASLRADLFAVSGSASGSHPGRVTLALDGATVIFAPARAFAPGETISVAVGPGLRLADGAPVAPAQFSFETGAPARLPPLAPADPATPAWPAADASASTAIRPSAVLTAPPRLTVTAPASGTADGLIFYAVFTTVLTAPRFIAIADNTGEPVFFQQTEDQKTPADFKVQRVQGKDYLTYHVGVQEQWGTSGESYVLDDTYALSRTLRAGNGYVADLHDTILLDDGNAILMIYAPRLADLSAVGGLPNATVLDLIVQEQDAASNVVFEWRSNDHIPITTTYVSLTTTIVDYIHGNAVDVDFDGNWLISNRHTSDVIKVDRQSGDVLWKLGGKENQFAFTNDPGFSFQHDIRRLPNGNITIFDNANLTNQTTSRVVEYEIDEAAKVVTRTREITPDPEQRRLFMGNAQLLANGNTFVGWGGATFVKADVLMTEVRPDNTKAFEAVLDDYYAYRAFRFPWVGRPTTSPALSVSEAGVTVTLRTSWNGATEVSAYRVYSGTNPFMMSPGAVYPRTGFETIITLTDLAADACLLQVVPLDKQGLPMRPSDLVYRGPSCDGRFLSKSYAPVVSRHEPPQIPEPQP